MTFLVTVETGGMTHALTSRADNVGGIILVVGVEPELFQARLCFKRHCFFFSFQTFLSEVSPFSDHKECGGLYWAKAFLDSSSQGSQVDKA